MKWLCASALVFAAAQSASAQTAAPYRFYSSISLGKSKFSVNCDQSVSCDRSPTAGHFTLGYQITPLTSLEATYAELGKHKRSTNLPPGILISETYRARALGAGTALRVPLDDERRWIATGRIGIASTRVRFKGEIPALPSVTASETHTRPFLGVGVDFALASSIAVGARFDLTSVKYGDDSPSVKTLGLALTVLF